MTKFEVSEHMSSILGLALETLSRSPSDVGRACEPGLTELTEFEEHLSQCSRKAPHRP
jgi:hypothetical protein